MNGGDGRFSDRGRGAGRASAAALPSDADAVDFGAVSWSRPPALARNEVNAGTWGALCESPSLERSATRPARVRGRDSCGPRLWAAAWRLGSTVAAVAGARGGEIEGQRC